MNWELIGSVVSLIWLVGAVFTALWLIKGQILPDPWHELLFLGVGILIVSAFWPIIALLVGYVWASDWIYIIRHRNGR